MQTEFGQTSSASEIPSSAVLQNLGDAILLLDESQRILFLNRAGADLFECAADEALGKRLGEVPALRQIAAIFERSVPSEARREGGWKDRLAYYRVSGELRFLEADVRRGSIGARMITTVVLRDVSKQAETEKALYQSQRMQAIGLLANGVAHDFNNILTGVLSHLDLMSVSPDLAPSLRQHVDHAMAGAKRGAEMVSKLLALSRLSERGRAKLELGRLAEDLLSILRRSIGRKIEVHPAASSPGLWPIEGDFNQVSQVLLNLCLVARDSMPQGGELDLRAENVVLSETDARPPRRAGEFVRVTVSDTGEGMEVEALSKLLSSGSGSPASRQGIRWELSVANSIVVDHGGWMEAELRPVRGSRFLVFFPRAREDAPVSGEPSSVSLGFDDREAAVSGTERLLVVDDEEVVRLVIRTILAYRGYQVEEAAHGEEAIELLGKQEPGAGYDLILLDVNMPRLNGWDTLKILRERNITTPIVLLSGGSPEGVTERAKEAAAAGLLMKPFENIELLRLVRQTLDTAKRTGAAGG